jgi:hypothetical protein
MTELRRQDVDMAGPSPTSTTSTTSTRPDHCPSGPSQDAELRVAEAGLLSECTALLVASPVLLTSCPRVSFHINSGQSSLYKKKAVPPPRAITSAPPVSQFFPKTLPLRLIVLRLESDASSLVFVPRNNSTFQPNPIQLNRNGSEEGCCPEAQGCWRRSSACKLSR